VIEPRAVLREFGVELAVDTTVDVHDSSAEPPWMVIPERPAGTEGLPEDERAALVTRDAMIGVASVAAPSAAARHRRAEATSVRLDLRLHEPISVLYQIG
jgi:nitrile hydratase